MRYFHQQNIVIFLVSLIIYYYNPSLGLVLLSLSAGLFITPKDLDEIFVSETMTRTAIFNGFNYGMNILSRHRCEWKLEFSNIWGTHYFYNDRLGKFEKTGHEEGTNKHWNLFWKAEPHLKIADHRSFPQ